MARYSNESGNRNCAENWHGTYRAKIEEITFTNGYGRHTIKRNDLIEFNMPNGQYSEGVVIAIGTVFLSLMRKAMVVVEVEWSIGRDSRKFIPLACIRKNLGEI